MSDLAQSRAANFHVALEMNTHGAVLTPSYECESATGLTSNLSRNVDMYYKGISQNVKLMLQNSAQLMLVERSMRAVVACNKSIEF